MKVFIAVLLVAVVAVIATSAQIEGQDACPTCPECAKGPITDARTVALNKEIDAARSRINTIQLAEGEGCPKCVSCAPAGLSLEPED
ncbi:hypothetical protein BV898_15456 [Hypsibius exemplaris]|uniref:Uncharacterized protein n=1 Tax=Hypsibius exemplaris TaxID=2072580 RepID=A0A9X6NB20_HYPEX|nr:hypothetical protein BV898_15456 [Hypsibius exemplaris]